MFSTPSPWRSPGERLPVRPLRRRHRVPLALRLLILCFCLLLCSAFLADWSFLARLAEAAGLGTRPAASSNLTFQQFLKEGRRDHVYHGPLVLPANMPNGPQPTHTTSLSQLPPSAEPPTMKPISQPLSTAFVSGGTGATGLDLPGSDGRLEVLVPAGVFDLSKACVASGGPPSGTLTLQLTQLHGRYVGQMNVLGSYSLQLVDSKGQVVSGVRLKATITIRYHYTQSLLDSLDLDPGHLLLTWPTLIAQALQAHQPTTGYQLALHNDAATHTLSTTSSIFGPGPFDMSGEPQNQSPPTLHLPGVQGNSGQFTYSYPLLVPPGPNGFGPQLILSYSSSGPNERHEPTTPARAEGDGWTLSLGSITEEYYSPTSTTYYFLNGVAGVGDRLIPTGSNNLFDTQHISYLRIQQQNVGQNNTCFHVWDKSGTYYELGCTPDSLQYWVDSSGTQHDYRWDVNKIIAPNEGANAGTYRIMLISYVQDSDTDPSTGHTAIRDAALKQVIYGTGSTTSVSSVDGTIDFFYHGPNTISSQSGDSSTTNTWVTAYGSNYNCAKAPPTTTTLRCDDPVTFGSNAYPPTVMSTLTLDSVVSYLGTDASSSSKDERYSFSYSYNSFKDNPFSSCYDPYTLIEEYCAGEHLLMSVTPTVYQNNAANTLKGVTFGYTSPLQNTYYDSTVKTQNGSQQFTAQNYWQYLNFYEDLETGSGGKISWARAYNNTDGTPTRKDNQGNVTDDRYDALYCTNYPGDCSQSSYSGHYAHPDDHAWSEQVVTSITLLGTDSSASALSQATITYSYYRLAKTGQWNGKSTYCYPDQNNQEQDCVGDNWLPSGDGDFRDYYHAEYEGFAQVWTTSPAGDLSVGYYYTSEGWYTPWSDYQNYEGGTLYQQEQYSGNSYNAANLLARTTETYANNSNACRSTSGTFPACEVVLLSTQTSDYELTNNSSPPSLTTSYTYDDYTTSGGLKGSGVYHNLTQQTISGTNLLPASLYPLTEQWSYTPNDQTTSGSPSWTYYTVNKPTHSELDDASGHSWQCTDITYDENSGNSLPAAGWPTTVKLYTSANCTSPRGSPKVTTYTGYDNLGNVVASVDGLGAANSSLYSGKGCTLSTAPAIFTTAWGLPRYTSCRVYDSYEAQPTKLTNAFGQSSTISYDYTQGALPTSVQDANGQTTSIAYSYPGGNPTTQTMLPLHSGSYTDKTQRTSTCTNTSTLPCYEADSSTYQYNTVESESFYDQQGRLVETRTPGPSSGYDTVTITTYNDQAHTAWQSVPFEVAHGTGWIDPNGAKDYQGVAPGGTVSFSDALGRVLAVQDPLFGQGQDGIACSATLSGNYTACTNYSLGTVNGDSHTYVSITGVDPNQHVTISYADALGRTVYVRYQSGRYGGTLTTNEKKDLQYNPLNEATSVVVHDLAPQSGQSVTSITTSASYNDLGWLSSLSDPDRGSHSYTYDQNGQLIEDVSGSRTIGYVYDLLGRVGCVEDAYPSYSPTGACTSGAHPYIQNTYDSSQLGTQGSTDFPVGRLTKSVATTYFPDGSSGTVTNLYQHDQRGRLVTEQLQLGLPSGWNVTTTLPTYQVAQSYNDADQPTTTTTSTNPAGQGYTATHLYDSTMGALTGLSNGSATLATLVYNSRAQLDTINFQTSSGGALASEQFSYDANLRPTGTNGAWLSGSGNSGTLFAQSRSYDPAGNVTSLTTTEAAVTGQSSTGGSETQNFCYDEQNRLVWAGNSGTQPSAGNGTCGSGTLSNSLNGAAYNNSYVYTHLGQLWQGPLNGGSTSYQYLYCNTQPHQLSGVYAAGSTCSSKNGAVYTTGYDNWGNVTSRTYSNTTATPSYDLFDHLTQWYVSATNQEQYLYDASGERVLRRSTTGTGTTITVYAFGLEDHQYSGSGTNQANTYYYTLAGRLIGALDSNGTIFYLTDELGSVLSSFTNAAGGASVKADQVFGPYGNARYNAGTFNTAKGFTGQYNDGLTGLDYYGARYYDPVVGVFLSADTVQGNPSGDNPYAYVGGNPETFSDPTGHLQAPDLLISEGAPDITGSGGGGISFTVDSSTIKALIIGVAVWWQRMMTGQTPQFPTPPAQHPTSSSPGPMFQYPVGANAAVLAAHHLPTPTDPMVENGPGPYHPAGQSGPGSSNPPALQPGGNGSGMRPPIPVAAPGGFCSFTSDTSVATDHGEQAIGKLHVGDKVWAYNPKTHKMELQPILHVWTHTDNDLVDVTITTTTPAHNGKAATRENEVVHTTSEHPFLTAEKGFVAASKLKVGMHVLRADGTVGVVTGWKLVHGKKTMYNLEVAQDHTFAVGQGKWVVHNECGPRDRQLLRQNLENAGVTIEDGQQAHHVIPCKFNTHNLVKAAGNQFDINADYNGRVMWDTYHRMEALYDMDSYHASHYSYNLRVEGMLDNAWQSLSATGPVTPARAANALMGIIDQLNQWIDTLGWLGTLGGAACRLY